MAAEYESLAELLLLSRRVAAPEAKNADADAQTMPAPQPVLPLAERMRQAPTLRDYEIRDLIAEGGMGQVYKAVQQRLGRLVAIKLPEIRGDLLRRFEIEAKAVAKLQHPNIVQIFDLCPTEDGRPAIIMEYLDGGSLARRLEQGRKLALPAAAQLVQTLAQAVHYAHRQEIIHRDLKPANILFTAQDIPKIADFGLAKSLNECARLTETHQIVGTAYYMAPEQTETSKVGPAADIYSLGAILYELTTGEMPFWKRDDELAIDVIHRVRFEEVNPPRELNGEIDEDLELIIQNCLRKDPRKRYRSADKLARDLQRWLDDKEIVPEPDSLRKWLWQWGTAHKAFVAACMFLLLTVAFFGLYRNARQEVDELQQQQVGPWRAERDVLLRQMTALVKEHDEAHTGVTQLKKHVIPELQKALALALAGKKDTELKLANALAEHKEAITDFQLADGKLKNLVKEYNTLVARAEQLEAEARKIPGLQQQLQSVSVEVRDTKQKLDEALAKLKVTEEHLKTANAEHNRLSMKHNNALTRIGQLELENSMIPTLKESLNTEKAARAKVEQDLGKKLQLQQLVEQIAKAPEAKVPIKSTSLTNPDTALRIYGKLAEADVKLLKKLAEIAKKSNARLGPVICDNEQSLQQVDKLFAKATLTRDFPRFVVTNKHIASYILFSSYDAYDPIRDEGEINARSDAMSDEPRLLTGKNLLMMHGNHPSNVWAYTTAESLNHRRVGSTIGSTEEFISEFFQKSQQHSR